MRSKPVVHPLAARYERPITIVGRPGASAPTRPRARPWRRGAERSIRVPAPTWLPFTAVAAPPGVPRYAETRQTNGGIVVCPTPAGRGTADAAAEQSTGWCSLAHCYGWVRITILDGEARPCPPGSMDTEGTPRAARLPVVRRPAFRGADARRRRTATGAGDAGGGRALPRRGREDRHAVRPHDDGRVREGDPGGGAASALWDRTSSKGDRDGHVHVNGEYVWVMRRTDLPTIDPGRR